MAEELLKIEALNKSFPGVKALEEVNFSLREGEIRALVGENGAGKSTLIKILAGIYQKNSGSIYFKNQEVEIKEPADARELGLAFIHQDVNLVPYFNAIENIWLGYQYPKDKLIFNKKKMKKKVLKLADKLNFKFDLKKPVSELSTADKWLVAILKAFMMDARLLVLDEPTAALTDKEIKELFSNLRRIKKMGIAIIYISHRLEEVFEIADTVTVLKNGQKVTDKKVDQLNKEELIKYMTGRKSLTRFPKRDKKAAKKEKVLELKNLSGNAFSNINLEVKKNEILGFFGLVGAGRTELMESLFALRDIKSGKVILNNKEIVPQNPAQMIDQGLALIPEDRRSEGLVLNFDLKENITLPNLKYFVKYKMLNKLDQKKEVRESKKQVEKLDIKTPSIKQPVKYLSGGNQQKVVISKWLYRDTEVFIFDEPTVGIDVGARTEVYQLINKLAQASGIIIVSSDILEIMGVCDRVAVMSGGRITGILEKEEFDQDRILQLAYEGVH
ncbi:MAG: sugar ABC transporter ATP-binding protein [Halanaerobium sp.]